jgi:drug/metabolite transporter (DMT)-like permease
VVYPIARGTSPGLLALWAYLFLGERPSAVAALGIVVLVAGLIIVGTHSRRTAPTGTPSYRSVGLALAVALLISLYSVVDGAAVQRINAFSYSGHIFALIPLLLTPLMFWRYGVPTMVNVWRLSAPRLVVTGVLMAGSYLLVLLVYQIAPVGYAGAVREVSVVFAALLGRVWFQEQVGLQRALGIACIFGGVLLVTLG